MTSNPTIFQKALEKSSLYNGQVRELQARKVAIDGVIRYLMAYADGFDDNALQEQLRGKDSWSIT